jgi:hypothetical protein
VADEALRARADARFEQALAERGARDPRGFYRERLKEMREQAPAAFREALAYFEQTLIPAVAAEGSDPLAAWLDYGRRLAELTAPGRTVQIDASGRSGEYAPPVPLDALVLHLPEQSSRPALVVGIPMQLSPAQRAAYDLLVKGSLGQ